MSQYPIILIPPQIQRVKSMLPPVESFDKLEPKKVLEKEPEKTTNTVVLVQAGAVTMSSAVIGNKVATEAGLLLFILGLGANRCSKNGDKSKPMASAKKNIEDKSLYIIRIYRNTTRQKLYTRERVKQSQSPKQIAVFQSKLLLSILG